LETLTNASVLSSIKTEPVRNRPAKIELLSCDELDVAGGDKDTRAIFLARKFMYNTARPKKPLGFGRG
jgi:hypothetical protein